MKDKAERAKKNWGATISITVFVESTNMPKSIRSKDAAVVIMNCARLSKILTVSEIKVCPNDSQNLSSSSLEDT